VARVPVTCLRGERWTPVAPVPVTCLRGDLYLPPEPILPSLVSLASGTWLIGWLRAGPTRSSVVSERGPGRRTRCTADGFRVWVMPWTSERNQRPASGPTGARNHRRTSLERCGSATSSTPACRAAERRAVLSSGRTTRRATSTACQPNRSRPMRVAERTFTSSGRRVPSIDPSSVLISTTSRTRVDACQARMSIYPRSP